MDKKIISTNRKANFLYEILETREAGIVLTGAEVKGLRKNKVSLSEGMVRPANGELYLENIHIAPEKPLIKYNPARPRKLLLHRQEINRLILRAQERGLTIVPVEMYFNQRGIAKVLIALARGKKLYDRREAIRRRETAREIRRILKK